MRQTEMERLKFLRDKKRQEQLSDKEETRLQSLEDKFQAEQLKEGKQDGRNDTGGNKQSDTSGHNTSNNSAGNGGKELRKSQSIKHGDGNKTDSDAGRSDKQVAGVNRKSTGRVGQSGDTSGSGGTESGEIGRRSDGDNRGTEAGRGTDRAGEPDNNGTANVIEQEEKRLVNLNQKPKDIKPKRKKTPTKKSNELDANLLAGILQTGFELIANVSGRRHWQISEEEAESVADPLDKILDNLTAKQKKAIEKYSAPVMLAGAVAGIVIPRLMVDIQLSKRSKLKGATPYVRSERTIDSNMSSDVKANIGVGQVDQSSRNSDNVPVDSSNNDPVIAGLFSQSN